MSLTSIINSLRFPLLRPIGLPLRQSASASSPLRLIFVSHEASRTGAPLILLNLLKHFQRHCPADYRAILQQGGALQSEFAKQCETECLDVPRQSGGLLAKRLSRWLARNAAAQGNVLAICNSMESRFITEQLNAHQIPVISLVHELPSSYSESDYRIVYRCSERVVFPVKCVRDATHHKLPLPNGKSMVLPQGLLNPEFGAGVKQADAREAIRDELGLPRDCAVVLGCGTLDLRKGIDQFAHVASQLLLRQEKQRDVHFVWIGDGPRWTHSLYHYVKMDLERKGIDRFVHFIGERDNVEPYFMGSDIFLMASRVDPFPCVVHEAMAAGLPIVTFDENGGACEAVSNGAGVVVPYGDFEQAAAMIDRLLISPEWAAELGVRSRQRVGTKYRFCDYGDRLIELVENVMQRNLRPAAAPLPLARAA